MNKILLSLLLVSVCFCQEETLIQLENGVGLTNLNKLMTIDYSNLNCQTNLLQMSHQLKMWAELYQDERVIHHEIRLLSTAHKILNQQRFNRFRNSNTVQRAKRILAALKHNTHKKQHTIYQQWRVNEIDQLKHSIQLLQTSTTEDDSKQCCDRIEKLINKFLDERKHIAKQCGNADVTINIINDAEGKIQVINKKCNEQDSDVKINRYDSIDQVIVGQSQQQKKEEQVVVTEKKQEVRQEQQVVQEPKEQQVVQQEQQVVQQPKEQEVVVQESKVQEVVVQQPKEQEVVVQQSQQQEVVVQESKEQEVVVQQSQQQQQAVEETQEDVVQESHEQQQTVEVDQEQTEIVTQQTVEGEEEEEEVEETVTKTTSTKDVDVPDDDDDDDVLEGDLVSAQGIGASGEGGRT